ncbi:uncharacterized protein H6S33_002172 [Morchella sextelata]|uniref:uncharacterized protein n=1 Tax=Morchella sextelata TaxID=1174677 RepID=UPI001D03BC1C|nr:uncharacterized protein H6S33_002172 [Morchella sextelata]KAH0608120.1 hypothetical protein H6S33_002172 [Morchella sextelata]
MTNEHITSQQPFARGNNLPHRLWLSDSTDYLSCVCSVGLGTRVRSKGRLLTSDWLHRVYLWASFELRVVAVVAVASAAAGTASTTAPHTGTVPTVPSSSSRRSTTKTIRARVVNLRGRNLTFTTPAGQCLKRRKEKVSCSALHRPTASASPSQSACILTAASQARTVANHNSPLLLPTQSSTLESVQFQVLQSDTGTFIVIILFYNLGVTTTLCKVPLSPAVFHWNGETLCAKRSGISTSVSSYSSLLVEDQPLHCRLPPHPITKYPRTHTPPTPPLPAAFEFSFRKIFGQRNRQTRALLCNFLERGKEKKIKNNKPTPNEGNSRVHVLRTSSLRLISSQPILRIYPIQSFFSEPTVVSLR